MLVTTMRSNDAFRGLPHDVFFFTMLQEFVARAVGVDVGEYVHCVGSLHVYDSDQERVAAYLNEGCQPTTQPMPSMPPGDQRSALATVLDLERRIRTEANFDPPDDVLDDYWMDLIRLLLAYRASRAENAAELKRHLDSLSSARYRPYVEDKGYSQGASTLA